MRSWGEFATAPTAPCPNPIKNPCSKKLKHFFIFVLAHKQAIRTSGSIGILYDHLFIGGLVLLRSIHSPYGK